MVATKARKKKTAARFADDPISVLDALGILPEQARSFAVGVRSKNRVLAIAAIAMLKAEHPMTLRQLFYRLVSAGNLSNAKAEYNRLGGLMTRLREAEDVPRTWIVDHVRNRLKPSSWSGLADFAESVRSCYRLDFWASLPVHVEIFVEKDAVAGTIQPVTEEYDVALQVCRGYTSVSFAGEIADQWRRIEKPIFAYYLGDYDPSGFDLERDLRDKLQRYSGRKIQKDGISWERLGVRDEDFDALDLIRLPIKMTDNRAAGFIQEHGDTGAEIDAIPPTELRRRVRQAIERHIDTDRWARLRIVEEAEKETLEAFVGQLEEGAQ